MKRITQTILALVLLANLMIIPSLAASQIAVQVGDQRIAFHEERPVIDENGRTLVPLAAVASALNMKTNWNGETKTVTFSLDYWVYQYPFSDPVKGRLMEATFEFVIDSNMFVFKRVWENEQTPEVHTIAMDTAPRILGSRTYAPISYLAAAAGYDVAWDGESKTVLLYLTGEDQPAIVPPQEGYYMDVTGLGQKHSTYWFNFTVNSIYKGETFGGYRADPGYVLYIVSVTETNTFHKALPMYDTDFYMESNVGGFNRYDPTYLAGDDFMPWEFTLGVGKTVTYLIPFEIPADKTDDLDFCYTEIAEGNLYRNSYKVDIY